METYLCHVVLNNDIIRISAKNKRDAKKKLKIKLSKIPLSRWVDKKQSSIEKF